MRFCCVRAVFVPNDAAPATFEGNVCVGLRKKQLSPQQTNILSLL